MVRPKNVISWFSGNEFIAYCMTITTHALAAQCCYVLNLYINTIQFQIRITWVRFPNIIITTQAQYFKITYFLVNFLCKCFYCAFMQCRPAFMLPNIIWNKKYEEKYDIIFIIHKLLLLSGRHQWFS